MLKQFLKLTLAALLVLPLLSPKPAAAVNCDMLKRRADKLQNKVNMMANRGQLIAQQVERKISGFYPKCDKIANTPVPSTGKMLEDEKAKFVEAFKYRMDVKSRMCLEKAEKKETAIRAAMAKSIQRVSNTITRLGAKRDAMLAKYNTCSRQPGYE